MNNNRGVVLIIVLWTLAILSITAAGLARKTSVEIALAKHNANKLKAKYSAWAGFIAAVDEIRKDTENQDTAGLDTLFQCGVSLAKGESAADLFEDQKIGEGTFEVSYWNTAGTMMPGLSDEDRRININALQPFNYLVFRNLLTLAGVDEGLAEGIAASVVDWQDADDTVTANGLGAENDHYAGLPNGYKCKNKYFDHSEELLLVRGMTPEIFEKIKHYVTVFPKGGNLAVNFDTAPEIVLKALARNLAGPSTNTEVSDADSLVAKMLAYRAGKDGREGTEDDTLIDAGMPMNQKENVIFLSMSLNRAASSKYLRVRVKGIEKNSGVSTVIEAVVERTSLGVVQWSLN